MKINDEFFRDWNCISMRSYALAARWALILQNEAKMTHRPTYTTDGGPTEHRNSDLGLSPEDLEANTSKAREYYSKGNYSKAFPAAIKSNLQDPVVPTMLAVMFLYGQGVKKSYPEAFYWAKVASDKGEPLGSSIVAEMYETYKVSADMESKLGVQTRLPQIEYFSLTSNFEYLPRIIRNVNDSEKLEDGTPIFKYEIAYRKMCNEKRWYYAALAVLQESTIGENHAYLDEMKELAEKNIPYAQAILAVLYENGICGIEKNIPLAAHYDMLLPKDKPLYSFPFRDFFLGMLYFKGIGLTQDDLMAEKLFRNAKEGGSEFGASCLNLLLLYKMEAENLKLAGMTENRLTREKIKYTKPQETPSESYEDSPFESNDSRDKEPELAKPSGDEPWTRDDTKWLLVGLSFFALFLWGAYSFLRFIAKTVWNFLFS